MPIFSPRDSEFELTDIRQRVQTQMDLGIALAELQGVSEELDEYRRADEQILSIEIFDDTGIVLFSTDPSFLGDLVTEEWVTSWRPAAAGKSGPICSVTPVSSGSRCETTSAGT